MNWQSLQSWLTKLHPDTWPGALALAVLFWIGGLILSWVLHRAIRLIMERDRDQRIDRMAASFLSKVASVFVWVVILMFYAHMIPALDRLSTALLASVSVASIVIGLAAQSTLANFVSGLSLIFLSSFSPGRPCSDQRAHGIGDRDSRGRVSRLHCSSDLRQSACDHIQLGDIQHCHGQPDGSSSKSDGNRAVLDQL